MQVRQSAEADLPETSWASSPAARATMRSNTRRDTGPELRVRRLLHARGLRYRVDWPLPFNRRRRADIAFTAVKVTVFIDGCFWHGCPQHYIPPVSHREYWATKVDRNTARDRETTAQLTEQGWTVLRFWEHEPAETVARTIAKEVSRMRPRT